MDKITEYLKQLELSDIEAKLYLTLLKTGPVSVRDLAEATNIKRTTAYLYIDQLTEKGLIMKIVKGANKLVAANPPESSLEHLVKKKLEKANVIQEEFPDMIQTITTSLPQVSELKDAEIKYYKGINGVQKIYEEALLNAMELRAYVKVETTGGLFTDNIHLFDTAFRRNPHLKVKELIYDSPAALIEAKKLARNDRYLYKLMPKELKLTSGDLLMYDDTVAILNYKGKISGVILHSKDYYNNSKELFDFIWKMLPDIS